MCELNKKCGPCSLKEEVKGDRVIVGTKHLPGTYVGLTNKNNKHIIKLDNGSFVEVQPHQWINGGDYEAIKKQNRAEGGKQAAKTRMADQIDMWKDELRDAQRELRQLYRDQEEEVGQLEGGTDEFEATRRHDEYGGQMNKLEQQIEQLKSQLRKYDELDESRSLTESILRENAIDIEKYADVIEYFENGLGLLKGLNMTDLSPTAYDSLSKLQHIIMKLGGELGNNTEMRDN